MNTPKHYQPNTVVKEEPIEIMYRSMSKESFEGYCLGNVIKYLSRYKEKGGEADLDKAISYIEFIRCAYRGESPLYAVRK